MNYNNKHKQSIRVCLPFCLVMTFFIAVVISYGFPGGCGWFGDGDEDSLRNDDEDGDTVILYDENGDEVIFSRQNSRKDQILSNSMGNLALIHVDADKGDDTNSGDFKHPFKTILKAKNYIKDNKITGATVCIKGTHELTEPLVFTEADSGSTRKPNIYTSCQREKAVIKGSKKISGFSVYKDKILVTNLESQGITKEPQQIFLNGERQILARYPNYDPSDPIGGGFLYVDKETPCGTEKEGYFQGFKYKVSDISPSGWSKIDAIEVMVFPDWNYKSLLLDVNSINESERMINLKGGVNQNNAGGICANNRYYLQNIFEELNAPNEWYYDNSNKLLYFSPPDTNFLENNNFISIAKVDKALSFNNAHDIIFDNIIIEEFESNPDIYYNSAIHIESSKYITIKNSTIRNTKDIGVYGLNSQFIVIDSNEIYKTGGYATQFRNSDAEYKKLEKSNIKITNNNIHHTSSILVGGGGTVSLEKIVGATIAYNHIHDIQRVAIMFTGNENIIANNVIHDINQKTQDSSAIYIQGAPNWPSWGNIIRNNVIDGTGGYCYDDTQQKWISPCYTWGIYLDGLASGTTVDGNIVKGAFRGGMLINGGVYNKITNNTIIGSLNYSQMQFSIGHDPNSTILQDRYNELMKLKEEVPLFFEKYPNLFDIENNPPDCGFMAHNEFKNNTIIYPENNTNLYEALCLDYESTEIDNNIYWAGGKEVIAHVSEWNATDGFVTKSTTIDDWKKLGYDVTSMDISSWYNIVPAFNNVSDDYKFYVNTEKKVKKINLEMSYCDLNGAKVSGNIKINPFESKVLLSCYCNNDFKCNNNETKNSCPNDCSKETFIGFDINGNNKYAEIPHNNIYNFKPTDSYTIEFLINTTQDSSPDFYESIIAEKYDGVGYPFSIRMIVQSDGFSINNSGSPAFFVYDGKKPVAVTGAQAINDGKWHHLAFVRLAGDSLRIFVDGKLRGQAPDGNFASIENSSIISLGRRNINYSSKPHAFIGSIQDFRISKGALYTKDFTPSPYSATDNTVGYWKLFDNYTENNKTIIPDSSENENDGWIILK